MVVDIYQTPMFHYYYHYYHYYYYYYYYYYYCYYYSDKKVGKGHPALVGMTKSVRDT